MSTILQIARKDLKLLWRDRAAVFWVLAWPLVFAFFFGSIMGGGGSSVRSGMKIAVVDEDNTEVSQAYVSKLEESDALRVQKMDRAAAYDGVRKGELVAYVIIERGYGETNSMFGPSEKALKIGMDPSRQAEKGMLQGILSQAKFKGVQDQLSDPVKMREQLRQSTEQVQGSTNMSKEEKSNLQKLFAALDQFYENSDSEVVGGGMQIGGSEFVVEDVQRDQVGRPRSAFEISFPSAMMWALIATAATFAVSMVLEREGGTLLRLRSAPLSRMQIMTGKALACFLTSVGVVTVLITLAQLFFKVRVGSPVNLVLAVLAAGFCFTGLMMLMSVLGKTPRAVGGVGWATMLLFSMFGGGMIPLIFMPEWMQTASNVSPNKWAILAFEGGVWRDFSTADMLLPLSILLGIGLVGFMIGVRVFSWTDA